MISFEVTILETKKVTHNVKRFRFEKPQGYQFHPGQATDVAIPKPGWEKELRPFTFTSLAEDPWLEFTIKRYPDRHGVTDEIHRLVPGDKLVIHEPWGAIEYGGPGYFIAGGAGITPFMAILRRLHKDDKMAGNSLYFSNQTAADIIYENELAEMLGKNAHFILSRESRKGYFNGRINQQFLESQSLDFTRHFYVCGPDQMIHDINELLVKMGAKAESLVFEK